MKQLLTFMALTGLTGFHLLGSMPVFALPLSASSTSAVPVSSVPLSASSTSVLPAPELPATTAHTISLNSTVLPYETVSGPEFIDAPSEDQELPPGWDFSWDLGVSGSQASYSNWAQGGSNNIAFTGSSLYKFSYTEGKFKLDSSLNTRYGQAKVDGDGVRKTDDQFEFRNRLSYLLNHGETELKLFGSLNFRTQFDRGFEYDKGPDGSDLLISNFMAPAYITENLGLAVEPAQNLSLEAGIALQQTVIQDEDLRERYKFASDESLRNEGGVILAATYSFRLADNMSVNSSLETFTSVDKSVKSTDFVFKNQITGKINSYVNAGLRFDIAYDDDFSDELQVAQVLTLGISLAFFED